MSDPDSMFDWRKAILKSDLPPTTRHVLLTLACHMNGVGESCFPSIELLCKETGLSNRAVITHLQNAKEIGWIIVGKHGFAGQRWAAHEYHAAWPHNLREAAETFAKAVNDVHHLNKKAVNVVPKGSEPNDKKAVKEVHTSIPTSIPESTSLETFLAGVNPQVARDFLKLRKDRKAILTETAMQGFIRESKKANVSLELALRTCCEQTWTGFRADWYQKINSNTSAKPAKFDPVAFVNRNAIKQGGPIEKLVN